MAEVASPPVLVVQQRGPTSPKPVTATRNVGGPGNMLNRQQQMAQGSQPSFRVQQLMGRHAHHTNRDDNMQGFMNRKNSLNNNSVRSGQSMGNSGFRVPRQISQRRAMNMSLHGSSRSDLQHSFGNGTYDSSIPDFSNSFLITDLNDMGDLSGSDHGFSLTADHGSGHRSFTSASAASSKWGQQSVKFRAQQFVAAKNGSLDAHYQVGNLLGEGGFGEVYECVDKQSGEGRAVKVIAKQPKPEDNQKVILEFEVIKHLDHPNILKLYALFESETHFFLVTDLYTGGELYDELEEFGRFDEDDAAMLMNNVLSCLNYCHKKKLAHRDLKPENILLEANKNFEDLKIIDFGLAAYGDRFTDLEGSTYYMSPQVIQGDYDSKCDIWSCGVIAYVCLAGFAPFDGEEEQDVVQNILCGRIDFDDEVWDDCSEDAMDFIGYLLSYDEDNRPTAEEALQHPWLQRIRQRRDVRCEKRRHSTRMSLGNLQSFQANSKLKQCVCSLIASQFLKKHEKEEIDAVFRSLDHDCDGKLTRADVVTSYQEFFGKTLSEGDLDSMFEHVNFSGSGAIEYSEFVVASLMEKNLIDDAKLMAAFRIFDKENKGYISVDNLKEVLALDDDMDGYILNVIVRQVDDDGDGNISFEEFKDMMFSNAIIPPKPKSRRSRGSGNNNGGVARSSNRSTSSGTTQSVDSFSMASSVALTIAEDLFEEEDDSVDSVRRNGNHNKAQEQQARRNKDLLGGLNDSLDDMSISNNSFRHVFTMFDEKILGNREKEIVVPQPLPSRWESGSRGQSQQHNST